VTIAPDHFPPGTTLPAAGPAAPGAGAGVE
jgi:hypothetical protein